jgi:glycine/D-amino acid oxidase-like deaminating enzyme/nitrite reductase/ring-hydroxylating ferredoxin subunit
MSNVEHAMHRRDGENKSLWETDNLLSTAPEVNKNKVFDVIIIGGGITGLTTALNLQRAGQSCLLLESKNIGFGTTGGTSAHLNTFLDATYLEIDSDFGKEVSGMLASASKRMIAYIESNVDELGIDADFEYRDGYLFSQNEKETKQLIAIFSSSREAGIEVVDAKENGLPIAFEHCLKFSSQAQFHPLKYIQGIAKAFRELGGAILEDVFITDLEKEDHLHLAISSQGMFKAQNIIWATHIPPGINILSLRNAPYRSYVIAVRLKGDDYPNCLSYDMKEPYHYFRSHEINGKKYLLIGGEDHKTGHGDPEQALLDLETYARDHFEIESIDYRWSSQYYIPVDGLPYIGKLPGGDEGIYVATGFNGNGMIFGSLSGEILTDLILGKENELAKVLSPSRLKPISGFSEFIKENADVAYRFVADRFGNELLDSVRELANGEGRVADVNGEKLAVYKNEHGDVSALSPVCTHAGCIVNWNPTEKSWDCPCHGGRFSIDGHVVTGPPRKNLEKIALSK